MSTNTSLYIRSMDAKIQMAREMREEDMLFRYNGVLYPHFVCPEEQMKSLGNFKAREDDVMLASYPKCGFNWTVGVLSRIVSAATGLDMEPKMVSQIEFFGPEELKAADESPSPRLLGSHMHPDRIPTSFYTKKTKILMLFRNPKDTLVSYYHFHNNIPGLPKQSWDDFFSNFMSGEVAYGSYFDNILGWEKRMEDPNILVVTYEELKQDLSKNIRMISSFFGFSLTEAQVQQIAENSTFSAVKKSPVGLSTFGTSVFRKGEVGDWKNHFTPEQSQKMDEAFNKHLAGTRLGAKLNYQTYCQ